MGGPTHLVALRQHELHPAPAAVGEHGRGHSHLLTGLHGNGGSREAGDCRNTGVVQWWCSMGMVLPIFPPACAGNGQQRQRFGW